MKHFGVFIAVILILGLLCTPESSAQHGVNMERKQWLGNGVRL